MAAPLLIASCTPSTTVVNAFEGGIGGLGKTKPATGVVLWNEESAPIQNPTGIITAELNVRGQPVLTTFQTPWPLLPTTGGLEARDLQNSESAFVQIVENNAKTNSDPTTKTGMLQLLLDSVLSQQGKFGAYGSPMDIKVKQLQVDDKSGVVTCGVNFTTLTPGLRESERQILVKAIPLNKNKGVDDWILLIVGTTRQRFSSQSAVLQNVIDSFEAVVAPTSTGRR